MWITQDYSNDTYAKLQMLRAAFTGSVGRRQRNLFFQYWFPGMKKQLKSFTMEFIPFAGVVFNI